MKREQLEHILRAASRIVDERDFLVVGSAAPSARSTTTSFARCGCTAPLPAAS